ncbi:AlpA family transcriptional regulator [Burkholderia semiarida]|nr:AlpA family transcriptional regulator [Burkholderia semiarida]
MKASASSSTSFEPGPVDLPLVGKIRWPRVKPHVPYCRNQWYSLGLAGKVPAPIRLTERCTVWDAAEIRRWIADPLGYVVPSPEDREAA